LFKHKEQMKFQENTIKHQNLTKQIKHKNAHFTFKLKQPLQQTNKSKELIHSYNY